MQTLEPPNTHYVSSAIGWMELGNLAEARAELNQVEPAFQSHPDVLEVKWLVAAKAGEWDDGVTIARQLTRLAPDRPSGWLHQAYALRRATQGGLEQAWGVLIKASQKFPREPTIAYNISCYACQLQQLDVARQWLERAAKIGEKRHIKEMALQDPDLAALWSEIKKL